MTRPTARTAAESVASTLRARGFQALFAGGCVRDLLLGLLPKDYDVATDAPPEAVVKLFRRTEKVGAKFGVVIVRLMGAQIEVATFRSDGDYSDGRRPDAVRFASPEEDARRRDFTINGMFLDPADGRIIDLVGGQADLSDRLIRAIGDPELRFAEDHLRMLRAVRFGARLGFQVHPGTLEAIRRHASAIRGISAERIQQELDRILGGPGRRRGWELLAETGLVDHVTPGVEWIPAAVTEVSKRLAPLLDDADFMLAFAAVLVGFGPAAAARTCRELRSSVTLERGVAWLIEMLPRALSAPALELADVKLLMADARFPRLVQLARAECLGVHGSPAGYEALLGRTSAVAPERVAPPPLLGGEDLQAMNVPPGPIYSRVLDAVYHAQLNETLTTREQAIELARALLSQP